MNLFVTGEEKRTPPQIQGGRQENAPTKEVVRQFQQREHISHPLLTQAINSEEIRLIG